MGHVDHGKTTLLDRIRASNVAASEAGGITQHIGAFHITLPQGKGGITFFDTPGHESFTAMRQRGVQATDIVVLVVALDDGIMPQTVESVRLAQQHSVPMIVTFNKCDKFLSNLDRIKQQLFKHSVQLEEYGGDTQSVCISALHGTNVPDLLSAIAAQAEMLELKADPEGPVEGFVVESKMSFGIGIGCTLIIQHGTLHLGDILVSERVYCRVKSIRLCTGESVETVGPGIPVEVAGWKGVPSVGTDCIQCLSEKEAQRIIESYDMLQRVQHLSDEYRKMEQAKHQQQKLLQHTRQIIGDGQLLSQKKLVAEDEPEDTLPVFPLMIFCDVIGSLEALCQSIKAIPQSKIKVSLTHTDIGFPSPNDLELARLTKSAIFCFNLQPDQKIIRQAKSKNIYLNSFNIIYHLIDDLKDKMTCALPPSISHAIISVAQVKQVFVIDCKPSKRAFVAGCLVKEGTFYKVEKDEKNRFVRVVRNGGVILESGYVESLKHLKDEVREIAKGKECGIILGPMEFRDFIPGDSIELIKVVKEKQELA